MAIDPKESKLPGEVVPIPTVFEKYDLPKTSKILVRVPVADEPTIRTSEVSVGKIASESEVVENAVEPPLPPVVMSVPHVGTPPATFRTVPALPTGSVVRLLDEFAYKMSPIV